MQKSMLERDRWIVRYANAWHLIVFDLPMFYGAHFCFALLVQHIVNRRTYVIAYTSCAALMVLLILHRMHAA
jgi:hypothetical protein